MPLTDEDKKSIVSYRIEKAKGALVEAKDCATMNHWSLAANRLYYAAYYASSALLVRTGLLTKEDGALLARLQNMRHTGDYDDFMDWNREDVEPCFPKVEASIEKVKAMI